MQKLWHVTILLFCCVCAWKLALLSISALALHSVVGPAPGLEAVIGAQRSCGYFKLPISAQIISFLTDWVAEVSSLTRIQAIGTDIVYQDF